MSASALNSWQAMLRRNMAIALVCAAVGVVVALSILTPLMGGAVGRFVQTAQQIVGPVLAERCLADPKHFGVDRDDLRVYAYDPSTFISANVDAPPPDPQLVARYRAGEKQPSRVFLDGSWGGGTLVSHVGVGPCGVAEVRWAQPPGLRPRLALGIASVAVASLIVVAGLASTLTVRPLMRRLDTLREGAERIGTPRYSPAERVSGDPLDVLAGVIDDAHHRTTRAREEEEARRAALEDHLDDVAHDLRTPLAALQLHLESAAAEAPASLRERLDTALGDITYLTQLTANLRAGAALRDRPGDESCDLAEVVARVLARFEVIGRHAGVEVAGAVPDQPVRVACASGLTEQAVANLVHNAVRHNRPGGHVSVLLTFTPEGFRLEVADDGPGVPPERLDSLGQISRSESRVHLGLSITRAVCARAGWRLRFSNLDAGGLLAEITGASTNS